MTKEPKTFDIPAAVRSEDVVLVTNVLTALEALDKCEAYKVPHARHPSTHLAHTTCPPQRMPFKPFWDVCVGGDSTRERHYQHLWRAEG